MAMLQKKSCHLSHSPGASKHLLLTGRINMQCSARSAEAHTETQTRDDTHGKPQMMSVAMCISATAAVRESTTRLNSSTVYSRRMACEEVGGMACRRTRWMCRGGTVWTPHWGVSHHQGRPFGSVGWPHSMIPENVIWNALNLLPSSRYTPDFIAPTHPSLSLHCSCSPVILYCCLTGRAGAGTCTRTDG